MKNLPFVYSFFEGGTMPGERRGKEMDKALERFLKYVKIDTQSNNESTSTPSEAKELNLSREILKDLEELGIHGEIDEYGRLYAHLPGEEGLDPIGLNSHVDTALEISGANVKPRIVEHYDGGIIKLNDEYSMSPEQFPSLKDHIGDDLVVTDGTTLLGGDDKAGDAIILGAMDYLVHHPEIKHHPVCLLFTPDEEIGRGSEHVNIKKWGAKYAYTVDGSCYKDIEVETFNAAHAEVKIEGVSVHPGDAKGKMVNAASLAAEFDCALPELIRPQYTESHEGFNHLVSMEGNVDHATLSYILRNHDAKKLEEQKACFREIAAKLQQKYPSAKINLEIGDDYRNMKEVLDKNPEAYEKAAKAYEKLGIEHTSHPIRGGTDGATFSFLGVPCPNIGTGAYNYHGRYEYLSVNEFHKMIEIVVEILKA